MILSYSGAPITPEPGEEVTSEPEEPLRPEINPVTGDVVGVATKEPI